MDLFVNPELLFRPIAQEISVSLERGQPFSYTYAKETYHFAAAYAGLATLEHLSFDVKVGVGQTKVYGRTRGKIILFLDDYPGTEFTETDTPGLYAALLKSNRRYLRPGEPLPAAFASFTAQRMRDLIHGPFVPRAQAVVVPEEDLANMVRFAFIKRVYQERVEKGAKMTGPRYNYSPGGEDQFKGRALETGIIREIRGSEYQARGDRTPIPVKGKPLSQEVIEERR